MFLTKLKFAAEVMVSLGILALACVVATGPAHR